jgi:hypothetical protein
MKALGKAQCPLTGKVLEDTDHMVCFPHFIFDRADPLWRFSESCMLREAFDKWESRGTFLARWKSFVSEQYSSPHWERLLENNDFLILFGKAERKIRLIFLGHGLTIDMPTIKWCSFQMFLNMFEDRHSMEPLLFGDSISVHSGLNGMRIVVTAGLPQAHRRQDRIDLSKNEWNSLLRAVDIVADSDVVAAQD